MSGRACFLVGLLGAFGPITSYGAPFHTDTPDARITNGGIETESSVFVSPLNADVVLVSNNKLAGNPPTSTGVSAWISTDGGVTWVDQSSPLPNSFGDPACVVGRVGGANGRFFGNYIGSGTAPQIASFKDESDPAELWNDRIVFEDIFSPTDKNHLWVDNSLSSSHSGNLYCAWTGNTQFAVAGILITRSLDNGESWDPIPSQIEHAIVNRGYLGVNLQTSSSGAVYAAWAVTRTASDDTEIDLQFSASLNGGAFWSPPTIIEDRVNGLGVSSVRAPGITMRGNSFPSMAVDQNTGDIYLVWANRGVPENVSGTSNRETDIYIIKSVNGGADWDALGACPKRVNNPGAVGNECGGTGPCGTLCGGDGDQWHPWITWDDATGALAVIYLSSKGHATQAETNVAVSHDGGGSWQELKVSDELGSGDFGAGYDYIGISARDGIAYPVWSDDRQSENPVRHRAYTSPILLWGPDEDTLGASFTQNAQGDHEITVTWQTNHDAGEEDTLILTPPSGPDVTITQSPAPDGFNHSVTTTQPCQLGDWTYVVKSTRRGRTASSTVRTFSTPTGVVTAEVLTYPQSNHFVVCPAGDGAPLEVTVSFGNHCNATIAAARTELDALLVNHPNPAFFPPGVLTPADEDADSGNGFVATITKAQVGGCGETSVPVFLDGRSIGIASFGVRSPDLNGDGYVSASDLPLVPPLGTCQGDPYWLDCADFVPSGCYNASDNASFASHWGHDWTNPMSKTVRGVQVVTELILQPSPSPGKAMFLLRAHGIDGRAAMGAVLRPDPTKLRFLAWHPSDGYVEAPFAFASQDDHGARVAVLVRDVASSGGSLDLGFVEFEVMGQVSASDLVITYEDVAYYDTVIDSARRGTGERTTPPMSRLDANYPNPFNPQTTIRYTTVGVSRVRLLVYDVAGGLVRSLVDRQQGRGQYSVVWNGEDDHGRPVGSGVYFYILNAGDYVQTRKLVVVR